MNAAAGTAGALPAVGVLWPGGERRLTRRPGRGPALLVLPHRRAPRMLVPTGIPGAHTMLRRHSTSHRQRLGQQALEAAVRTGLLSLLPVWRLGPGAGGVEDYVRAHVPEAAAVGVLLGPPRANAKPVLRVFSADGRTVAFGKVGHDALSAGLVRHEGRVLRDLEQAHFTALEIPAVLHAGRWKGLEILLLAPLGGAASPVGKRVPVSWHLPVVAMAELAEHGGTGRAALAGSPYLHRLRQRVEAVPDPARDSLQALLDEVSGRITGALHFGRWHGDWAPWNMGAHRGLAFPVAVWDWERSESGVPLGFDIVHFLLQREFSRGTPADRMTAVLLRDCAQAMQRWSVPADEVDTTVLLYVVEMLARYRSDSAAAITPQLRARVATLTSILTAVLADRPRSLRADA